MHDKIFYFSLYLMGIVPERWTTKIIQNFEGSVKSSAEKNALIHILKNCSVEHNTVMIIGDDDGSIAKSLFNLPSLTSVILCEELQFMGIYKKRVSFSKKIDAVIGKSLNQLVAMVNVSNKPSWWNVKTRYFIIQETNNSFLDDYEIHRLLYRTNIFEVYFMSDQQGVVTITTINPYNVYSPSSWKLIDTKKLYFLCALYTRLYDKENTCQGFYFDRTKNLSSYKIFYTTVAALDQSSSHHTIIEKDMEFFKTTNSYEYIGIFESSLKILSRQSSYLHEKYDYMLAESGSDSMIRRVYPMYMWNMLAHYSNYSDEMFPIHFYQVNFLVHHEGYMTFFQRICDYSSIWSCLFIIFILVITFMVLKLNNRMSGLIITPLNISRFLINKSIFTPIKFYSLKICLSVIFLYFLISHTIFFGYLVELLIKPRFNKNIQTLEDLKGSQYEIIYLQNAISNFTTDPELDSKIVSYKQNFECLAHITLSKSIVCAYNDYHLQQTPALFMHKSGRMLYKIPDSFGFNWEAFRVRRHWPLKSRFDLILIRVLESGLNNILRTEKLNKITPYGMYALQRDMAHFLPINLEMLTFAFVILGIGLTCAMISFIIEILSSKK